MLRLDFEKPKNLNTNTVIPNVAPDTGSNGTVRYASSATAKIVLRGFTANVTGSLTPDGAGFITGSRYFIISDGSYQTASIDLASGPVVAGNAIDGETITLRSIEWVK